MNPVLSQNVFKGLNEMPVDNQKKAVQPTPQSESFQQYNATQS